MKVLSLLLFFISTAVSAQFSIEKSDGTRIEATSIQFNPEKKKLKFKTEGNSKSQKLKFRDVRSVMADNLEFRNFNAGKYKGYFVKAGTSNYTLAFNNYMLSAGSTTGFRQKFEHVALAVFGADGQLIEERLLRPGNSSSEIQQRADAVNFIDKYFSDCPNLIRDMNTFLKSADDPRNFLILRYFSEKREKLDCN